MKTYLVLAALTVALPSAFCADYTPPGADEQAMLDRTEAALAAAATGTPAPVDNGRSREFAMALAKIGRAKSMAAATPQQALRELLSLYDEEYDAIPGFAGMRAQLVPREMARLDYRPAKDELRLRRDRAKVRLSDPKDTTAVLDYLGFSAALGENQAAIRLFDELPAGDPRRRSLSAHVFPTLVEKGRYKEAVEARPYSTMLVSAEAGSQLPRAIPEAARLRFADRRNENVVRDIEALVGAGLIENARALQTLLLERDGSKEMKAKINAALKRAGNPGALDAK